MVASAGSGSRGAGLGLIVYGVVGLILLTILALAVLYAAIRIQTVSDRISAERDQLVRLVDSTDKALGATGNALTGVGSSLNSASGALDSAAELASEVSTAAESLAGLGDISILGNQPFAGATGQLQKVAASAAKLATSIQAAGASLANNATDMATITATLTQIQAELANTRNSLSAIDFDLGGWPWLIAVFGLAVLGWLAVPAAAAIVIGRRWRSGGPAVAAG